MPVAGSNRLSHLSRERLAGVLVVLPREACFVLGKDGAVFVAVASHPVVPGRGGAVTHFVAGVPRHSPPPATTELAGGRTA